MKRIAMCAAVALVALLIAAVLGNSARAARSHAEVRCGGFGHEVLKYPSLYAIGKFHCATGAKKATETIVLQGYENGKWKTLESASRTVHPVAKNKTYVVKTPVITCSSSPHKENVRTLWTLTAGPLRLVTPPSGTFSTYCIGP